MADQHHRPANDAPAAEWKAYLKGRGYVSDAKEKPVTNYKSLHGFWVPPRLGSPSKDAAAKAAPKVRRARGAAIEIDAKWYSEKTLTALYRQNRTLFGKLEQRIKDIGVLVKDAEDAERLAAQRQLIEPAVEAGLLNQAEADRKVAAWAKSQGIRVPKD